MKWGYEGIRENGKIKICPENGIDLGNYFFEVPTFDDAARVCNEHNKTEERAAEAEKLLKEIIPAAKWQSCYFNKDADADPIFHCCDWSEWIKKANEFLGGDGG